MNAPDPDRVPLIADELDELHAIAGLSAQRIIELGCGPAQMARKLVRRFPGCSVAALEIDAVQHRKNLAEPQAGIEFIEAGAQAVPFAEASFDLAIMLKSLHHVPTPLIGQAISEVARVLKPGGLFYVSEPVYGEEFETKQMRPSYADHRLDDAKVAHVRAAFEPFQGPAGATFVRPLHVRVLRRLGR